MVEENVGMQLDLIKEALSCNGVTTFLRKPLGRNVMEYKSYNADGVMTFLPDYEHPKLNLSQPYIIYQNVAISLSENEFDITKLDDLSDKSVMAFQNVKRFLGE